MIGGMHDVQVPAGAQAHAIAGVWHWLLPICTFVFVAIVVAMLVALWRAPWLRETAAPDVSSLWAPEPKIARTVWAAVIASTLLLLVLLAVSVFTDRALARLPLANALHVQLTGYQWWWEARYDDPDPSRIFTTANELHVPVGRPVIVTLVGADVIHSFWVPSLHGKKDLIPGRTQTISFRADRPGVYRGTCAEYCGYQHAHMVLYVVADAPDDYAQWAQRQRAPARPPATAEERRGRDLFLRRSCAMCHAIDGTPAQGQHAPNLTHVAGRMTIGAGTLENTAARRAAWILDPQQFKPGANMPPENLPPDELAAINAYLGSLQ
ncbi:MAG TPA: cytochrome c oxidase subunit II [Casimicrobiaceae bacterium]|jgi:cytochrome c oxidase subunit 2|nr:cytochrome c oxidase subunit II [Casimicrobiaceae bacterium]